MGAYKEAAKKLGESIFSNDIIIFIAGMIAIFFFILTLTLAVITRNKIKSWKEKRNVEFSKHLTFCLSFCNTFFLTMVSLFPLLGMLGTVIGLLGLDIASGDMNNIKNNFFIALTSTAWGIIFSVGAKFIYAFASDFIEDKLEIAKKLSEEKEQ